MIHIGFTGTRHGMTEFQKVRFTQVVQIMRPTHFHHGGCVGADMQAEAIVIKTMPHVKVVTHKPQHDTPAAKLARNHDIVDASRLLYACPRTAEEELRSGTWATVRYARKCNKDVCIIYPAGRDKL